MKKDFLSYENPAHKIKIDYPSDWTKTEQVLGSVVVFTSPKKDSEIFRENINIMVQDLSSQQINLDQFTEISLTQIKQLISNANILESKKSTLNKNPGHKIVYTGNQGKYNLKLMQIWTIKDKKAYVITYTAREDKYKNYLSEVKQIINSFKFI